jgi:hypothetical protein
MVAVWFSEISSPSFLPQGALTMPTYYFHIRDGDTLILDDEGCELDDLEAIRNEALRSARDLHRQNATEQFFISSAPYISVCDEAGNEVLSQPIHLTNGEHRSDL